MSHTNPLVEVNTPETLKNVVSISKFLQEFLDEKQYKNFPDTANSKAAMSLIMLCTDSALEHEIDKLEEHNAQNITEATAPGKTTGQIGITALTDAEAKTETEAGNTIALAQDSETPVSVKGEIAEGATLEDQSAEHQVSEDDISEDNICEEQGPEKLSAKG